MLRESAVVVVTGLVTLGCGGGGDPVSDEVSEEVAEPSEPEPEAGPAPETEGVTEAESEAEPADVREARFVDAVAEMFDGAPSETIDVSCLSIAVVDAVGLDEFERAGVEPDELAGADNLEEVGVRVTLSLQTDVAAAFEDCVDGVGLSEQVLPSLELGFPEEVTECMAESMDQFVVRLVASEFIDGSGGVSVGTLGEAFRIGVSCAADLVATAPGSSVSWAEGPDVFEAALVLRMTTPVYEGALVTPEAEGVCFGAAVVDLLGPVLDDAPSTSVGNVMIYLSGSVTSEQIGITVSEEIALDLATANVACIDNNSTLAQATLAGLGPVASDPDAIQVMNSCLDEAIGDEIWIESLRLQFLYGPLVFELPEALPLFELLAQTGELCATRVAESVPAG